MTDAEFERGIAKLQALRTTKPSQDLKDLWYDAVYRLPGKAWLKAVDEWIESNTRFPSIREVKTMAYGYMTDLDRGEAPDRELTTAEVELNHIMFPLLGGWLRGEVSRETFLATLRFEANKRGLENSIDWQGFDGPVPWIPMPEGEQP